MEAQVEQCRPVTAGLTTVGTSESQLLLQDLRVNRMSENTATTEPSGKDLQTDRSGVRSFEVRDYQDQAGMAGVMLAVQETGLQNCGQSWEKRCHYG